MYKNDFSFWVIRGWIKTSSAFLSAEDDFRHLKDTNRIFNSNYLSARTCTYYLLKNAYFWKTNNRGADGTIIQGNMYLSLSSWLELTVMKNYNEYFKLCEMKISYKNSAENPHVFNLCFKFQGMLAIFKSTWN